MNALATSAVSNQSIHLQLVLLLHPTFCVRSKVTHHVAGQRSTCIFL